MPDSNISKERILNKIKQALVHPVPLPFTATNERGDSYYKAPSQDLEIEFAENFNVLQGKFSFCFNLQEALSNIQALLSARKWDKVYCIDENLKNAFSQTNWNITYHNDLSDCDIAITTCEALIARTGSIMLSSLGNSGRTTSVYAPVHICIAYTNQLVYDIKDGLQLIQDKYKDGVFPSLITLATGPSRTADIEKTLVVGVHGPKEVYCLLIDN